MEKLLLLTVRFLDDRYHGEGEWPPSPARLFQALVAGNAVGARLPKACVHALAWLEALDHAPEIRARPGRPGLPYTTFVPNNDLDAKGGDPAKVADIRVGKSIRPRHIDATQPILYGWRFTATPGQEQAADQVCAMADNLYQLGRGVDMAWAQAEVLPEDEGGKRLAEAEGTTYRPGAGTGERLLDCPQAGSLAGLQMRFQAQSQRFHSVKDGKKVKVHFANPPKARFRQVTYNPLPSRQLFDLRNREDTQSFRPWPREQAVTLTEQVRDALAKRLLDALPETADRIESLVIGRGAKPEDKARRVRLIPIPTIGYENADPAIRRFMIETPPDCPLRMDDLEWALSGLPIGEDEHTVLIRAENPSMLRHYAVESDETFQHWRRGKRPKTQRSKATSFRHWRSITPLALPARAARRRIDPDALNAETASRLRGEPGAAAKTGSERAREETAAMHAVREALRHADIKARPITIQVQREPFDKRGTRAEAFAQGARFPKERLWHVALRFDRPVTGPLLLGDGRYLGLGLMAPEPEWDSPGIFQFRITSGLQPTATPEELTSALRRAVMALAQNEKGPKHVLEPFFTGHDSKDGSPLREGHHRHLSFAADLKRKRLLVIAPHTLEHRTTSKEEQGHLKLLDGVLSQLEQLRAGPAGLLTLKPVYTKQDEDPLFGAFQAWESITPYRPNRHPKKSGDAEIFVKRDLLETLRLYTNEIPIIEILHIDHGPRGGLTTRLRLRFRRQTAGPFLLGKDRHKGGGLFGAVG